MKIYKPDYPRMAARLKPVPMFYVGRLFYSRIAATRRMLRHTLKMPSHRRFPGSPH
jgi:hypothetical protein